jgi:hypothetical protein
MDCWEDFFMTSFPLRRGSNWQPLHKHCGGRASGGAGNLQSSRRGVRRGLWQRQPVGERLPTEKVRLMSPSAIFLYSRTRFLGVDIMPFAAHLAALNLTIQDLSNRHRSYSDCNGLALQHIFNLHPQVIRLCRTYQGKYVDLDMDSTPAFALPDNGGVVIHESTFTDRKRVANQNVGTIL